MNPLALLEMAENPPPGTDPAVLIRSLSGALRCALATQGHMHAKIGRMRAELRRKEARGIRFKRMWQDGQRLLNKIREGE